MWRPKCEKERKPHTTSSYQNQIFITPLLSIMAQNQIQLGVQQALCFFLSFFLVTVASLCLRSSRPKYNNSTISYFIVLFLHLKLKTKQTKNFLLQFKTIKSLHNFKSQFKAITSDYVQIFGNSKVSLFLDFNIPSTAWGHIGRNNILNYSI